MDKFCLEYPPEFYTFLEKYINDNSESIEKYGVVIAHKPLFFSTNGPSYIAVTETRIKKAPSVMENPPVD
jgi:hypothetical protein